MVPLFKENDKVRVKHRVGGNGDLGGKVGVVLREAGYMFAAQAVADVTQLIALYNSGGFEYVYLVHFENADWEVREGLLEKP